jgi:hypothetical protein
MHPALMLGLQIEVLGHTYNLERTANTNRHQKLLHALAVAAAAAAALQPRTAIPKPQAALAPLEDCNGVWRHVTFTSNVELASVPGASVPWSMVRTSKIRSLGILIADTRNAKLAAPRRMPVPAASRSMPTAPSSVRLMATVPPGRDVDSSNRPVIARWDGRPASE